MKSVHLQSAAPIEERGEDQFPASVGVLIAAFGALACWGVLLGIVRFIT